jgi:cell division protein FtsI (penicillin-binding protein 3)
MTTMLARPGATRSTAQRMHLTAIAHNRLMLLLILFVATSMLIVLRLLWMGIFAVGGNAQTIGTSLIPSRADIVDRNGVPLARTIDAWSITVRPPRLLGDPATLARQLATIFPDDSEAHFFKLLTSKKAEFIRRRALPEQVAAVNRLGEPGIEYPREKERFYPQRTLAAHLLGFTDIDGHGRMGVERAFDARLIDPAKRGQPLMLSIDSRVQAALESELYAGMTANSAKGAAGIILDAQTGEVIAMASLPVFNPNRLTPADSEARRNDVVQSRYELGSAFKPITMAAAMDAGVVTSMAKRYDATHNLQVGGYTIHDDHPMGRWLNVPETLIHSSNIVTAQIADQLGAAGMQKIFRELEFNRHPSIELKEAATPIWPSSWGRITTMTVGYGHGIAVTPLHLASAYAALVNGGIWRPATVLKRADGQVPAGRRIWTAATSARMRQLLRLIVSDGTGKMANAAGYRVGGKTGTAEKPHEGGYAKHSLVTTFASAFPMENPRYIVLCMMDEPHGSAEYWGVRTAAYTAAPVVRRVVERVGTMLGINPDLRRDVDVSDLVPLLWKAPGEKSE